MVDGDHVDYACADDTDDFVVKANITPPLEVSVKHCVLVNRFAGSLDDCNAEVHGVSVHLDE